MNDDYNDSFVLTTDEDLSWEAVHELHREMMEQKEYVLTKAIYDGYDGADVIFNTDGVVSQPTVIPWDERPPLFDSSTPRWRYDFRGMTFNDLREDND